MGMPDWNEALPLIEEGLREFPSLTASAAENILETLRQDLIAPQLGKNDLQVAATAFPEAIEEPEKPEVMVTFGPRDWSFDFKTGELLDCDTRVTLGSRRPS
jgi:hypothetical protein